jgi:hypothetical protein
VIVEAAEGFSGDAEIGGYELFGDEIVEFGVEFEEFFVAGFGIVVHEGEEAALSGDIAFVGTPAEEVFDRVDLAAEFFSVIVGYAEEFGVCDAVYVDGCAGLGVESVVVGGPPGGHGELEDMHFDLVVDEEGFEAAGCDEVFVGDFVAFADEDLVFFEGEGLEVGEEVFEFFFGERGDFGDMGFQEIPGVDFVHFSLDRG